METTSENSVHARYIERLKASIETQKRNDSKMYLAFCNLVQWAHKNLETASLVDLKQKRRVAHSLVSYVHATQDTPLTKHSYNRRISAVREIRDQINAQIAVASL